MRCVCCLWRVSGFYRETSHWLQKNASGHLVECCASWPLDVLVHCTHCIYGAVLLCCLCCVMWLEMSPTDFGRTHPFPNCNFSPASRQSKEQKLLMCMSMTTAQPTTAQPPADTRIARITCSTTQFGVFEHADTVALQTEGEHPGEGNKLCHYVYKPFNPMSNKLKLWNNVSSKVGSLKKALPVEPQAKQWASVQHTTTTRFSKL